MFLGHYGVALAARRAAPRESLGTTVAAAQWLDLLWPVLLLAGLERVRIDPGRMAASSLEFVSYPISHSLLAVVGWSVLAGALWLLLTRRGRGAWIVGLLVLSHWFLDLPMHEPDLPLRPGSATELGFGLWGSVAATVALEVGILAAGLALYLRGTRARDGIGRWGLGVMVAVLVLFWASSFVAPPPSEEALAWGGLVLWAFVPWAWWVDRHRDDLPHPPASGEDGAAGAGGRGGEA